MPTVLKINGYRFFFYANDHLPKHIHIEKNNCTAKIELENLIFTQSKNFNSKELKEIRILASINIQTLNEKWDEFFNN